MDNNQNMGQPISPQMDFTQQPQAGFVQPQMDNTQQPQMNYNQQQMGYGQQQMNYGQQQMGYNQQQMNYGQQQMGYGQQPQGYGPITPKPIKINKKAMLIVAAIAAVVLLIIFIPKLFKPDTPFDKIKLGMSTSKVMKEYDLTDDDYGIFGDTLRTKEDGFGVTGNLQICLDYDLLTVDRVNWYVYEEDCKSEKAYEDAIDEIIDYYTDECGKPEKYDDEYTWRKGGYKYELEVDDDEFTLRYKRD